MTENTFTAGQIEDRDDLPGKNDDAKEFEFWMRQTDLADKEDREFRRWAGRGLRRYRAEGRYASETQRPAKNSAKQELNMFWSNIQLLRPAIYARTPKPDVQRRWKQRDAISRLASMVIERGLTYYCDVGKFGDVIGQCVDDRLIIGRGVMRLLYVPHWSDDETDSEAAQKEGPAATDDAAGGPSEEAQDEEVNPHMTRDTEGTDESDKQQSPEEEEAEPEKPRVVYEELVWVHVPWDDYQEGPATTWTTVPWVKYIVRMNREKLIARFGKVKGKKVQLDASPKEHQKKDEDAGRKDIPSIYEEATVWEIWDREQKRVVWLAPGTPGLILDEFEDPMQLPGFFPGPEPVAATMTTDRRQPVSDYCVCYDQYLALDEVTRRIALLTRALKVAGAYAGDEKAVLQQLLSASMENVLIPVKNWAQFFSDKGGLDKLISWLPIDMVSKVLIQLYDVREKIKAELSEMSGIGDIMRGMSDPRETSEAQSIKAGFGTMRISAYQSGVQRFARDGVQLMAAALARHVEPPVLSLISGLPDLQDVPDVGPQPQPPPQMQQQALPPPGGQAVGGPPPGNALPGPAAAPAPGAPAPGPMPASSSPPAAPGAAPPGGGASAPAGNVVNMAGQPAQPPGQPPPPPDPAVQQFQQQMQQWQQALAATQAIQADNQQRYQEFMKACQLIRAEALHAFSVDVETDSMKALDEADDQEQRMDFLKAIFPMLQQILPMIKGDPEMASLSKELVLLGVRGFPIARSVEGAIEEAFDVLANKPSDAGQPPPSSQDDMIKAQSQAAESASRIQVAQINAGVAQQKSQAELQLQQKRLEGEQEEQAQKLGMQQQDMQSQHQFRQQRAEALQMRMVHGMGAA